MTATPPVQDLIDAIQRELVTIPLKQVMTPQQVRPEQFPDYPALAALVASWIGPVEEALDTCENNRGAFSCHEPHDLRCPKSRALSATEWKVEWVCVCGREALDTALAGLPWNCK